MTTLKAQSGYKRFMIGAAIAGITSTLSLGLTSGLESQMARAEQVGCDAEWAKQAMDSLKTKMGHTPPFSYCFNIDAEETDTIYITFEDIDIAMSENHAFVADCDTDCSDLDLRIYDEVGRLLDEDTSSNKEAEVNIHDVASGDTYRIELTMFDCDAEYCGVALGSTPRR